MTEFIKGLELCKGFFFEEAKPIINKHFPNIKYSAGLIGYGSDVLGYDDIVSCDHMWGPRFYMFLSQEDIKQKDAIFNAFAKNLPYTYKGFCVNFTSPDPNDNGVQHPHYVSEGDVNPLIFITTFSDFLNDELGIVDFDCLHAVDWLTLSEHRLLSITKGTLFYDDLNISETISKISFYPDDVRRYLIASNWDIIASEQAFIKRCSDVEDEIGSVIICTRIAERLMRLCFLYEKTYAPYSKWLGTAFSELNIDNRIKTAIYNAIHADNPLVREEEIVNAQSLVGEMHNNSGITPPIDFKTESYFGRNIKVIFADKFADITARTLDDSELTAFPLIGSLSQIGGLSSISDEKIYYERIKKLYTL